MAKSPLLPGIELLPLPDPSRERLERTAALWREPGYPAPPAPRWVTETGEVESAERGAMPLCDPACPWHVPRRVVAAAARLADPSADLEGATDECRHASRRLRSTGRDEPCWPAALVELDLASRVVAGDCAEGDRSKELLPVGPIDLPPRRGFVEVEGLVVLVSQGMGPDEVLRLMALGGGGARLEELVESMTCACGDPWLEHTVEGACTAVAGACVVSRRRCPGFSLAGWDEALTVPVPPSTPPPPSAARRPSLPSLARGMSYAAVSEADLGQSCACPHDEATGALLDPAAPPCPVCALIGTIACACDHPWIDHAEDGSCAACDREGAICAGFSLATWDETLATALGAAS